MSGVVTDTHPLVWYVLESPRLSARAFQTLDEAESGGSPIYVPSIVLVEMTYLIEKGRIPEIVGDRVEAMIDDEASVAILVPLDRHVARAVRRIARDLVPDMPDRIIAATALELDAPLVTRDRELRASPIPTIW